MVAMWLQDMDTSSLGDTRLLTIFIGVVALALVVQTIAAVLFAAKSAKAIGSLSESLEDLKQKALPLMDSAMEISRTTETLLRENAPKVKTIADNLLETSEMVRGTAQRCERTIADANLRTQHQMARVDGMVTAALTATVEIVETIGNGIRVPAQKIAAMAGQAKLLAEGALAKIKSMAAGTRFGS